MRAAAPPHIVVNPYRRISSGTQAGWRSAYFFNFLVQAGRSAHLLCRRCMKGAMGLEVVRDATQLSLGDMVVRDDGFVILSPKQCSNDAFLLGLVEWCVWHDRGGSREISRS
jgi:hypothetical protein